MSGLRNKNNRRGRPKRNNVTALQQHHLKEKTLVSSILNDLDISQPLTIVQPSNKLSSLSSSTSSSLSSSFVDNVDKKVPSVTERDSTTTIQHLINSDFTLSTSPCSSLTDTKASVSFESSELSSEDDTSPPPSLPKYKIKTINKSHGVDLDRLPKVQFIKGNTDDGLNYDEEDQIYQQEQLAQEELLLIQHYQMQQQHNSNNNTNSNNNNNNNTSALISNKDILKFSRIYNRPENHYIHYNELSDVELYDSVEYDMDEQDQCWLKLYNKERRKEFLGDISPYLFECIIDKLEKEWFNLVIMLLFMVLCIY